MYPDFLSIVPSAMAIYGMSLTIAMATGYRVVQHEAQRLHTPAEQVADLCFFGLIAAVCGSRLFYVWLDPDMLIYDKLAVIKFWQGGFVFYGGFIAALLTVAIYCKRKNLLLPRTLDLLTPGLILGQAIGQMGCLLSGCMHGRPCEYPWAVTYRSFDTMAPWGIPLHPVQFYAAGMSLGVFFFLWQRRTKKRFDGELFWLYVILDAISRLIVDHFRGDFLGVRIGNLFSIPQIIGGIFICLAAGVLIGKRRNPPMMHS